MNLIVSRINTDTILIEFEKYSCMYLIFQYWDIIIDNFEITFTSQKDA